MPDSPGWDLREAEPGADDAVIAAAMGEYLEWASRRLLEEYGVDDPPSDPRHVGASLQEFWRPHGVLLIAEHDGRAAGIGALRRLAGDVAEVKRMYVAPGWRGLHLGAAILDRLIEEARAMGATTLRLDTCRFMTDAQRLYRSRGFVERDAYEGTEIPLRIQQHWVFFERGLGGGG